MENSSMKWVQYNEYSISTLGKNGLVLYYRQDISIHSAEYSPMHYQLFMGEDVILFNAFI